MIKELEAFEEIIDKFAEQMIRANKEELTATNKTNAIEYLYRTPQVRLLNETLQRLEILKPLCEVYETPAKKYRYLKVRGVVVYEFKDIEEFNLFKEWLDE